MNLTISLTKIKSIDKIEGAWTHDDYIKLLEGFDYPDPNSIPENELLDMLQMAITDLEPDEAAEVVLTHALSDKLNEGQIKNLSHEMLEDKVAEEYPNISLHYPLFNVNQLLHDAYNGKFPKTLASVIDFELTFKGKIDVNKEIVLRAMSDLLSDKSLLKRLYTTQIDSSAELKDAESIIWKMKAVGENSYQIITSDYWINREDFDKDEHAGMLREDEIHHFTKGKA